MIPAILLACTPIAVYDADTWTCREGHKIRAAGYNTRELHGDPCPSNRPCPAMSAEEARRVLIRIMGARVTGKLRTGHLIVVAPVMECRQVGVSFKRIVADCSVNGQRIACAMIAAGAGAKWPEFWVRYDLPRCENG